MVESDKDGKDMRNLAGLAIGALMCASLAGCGGGGGDEADAPSGDGTLTFAANFTSTTLDPDLLPLQQETMYVAPLYDSLMYLDGDENLQPMLATSWEFGSDGTGTYLDLTLREGLEFEDGTPFTAATVLANIKRSQEFEGSTNAGILAGVAAEEIDATHVRLRSERIGALPRLLAGSAGMMISDKAIADGIDLTKKAVGIGAFELQQVEPNRILYAANDDYWDDGAAAVDTLEVVYLTDDAKLNAVRSGTVDITYLSERLAGPAEDAGYTVEPSFGADNYEFYINTDIKPFDDPRVREAVNLSIDRQAICDTVLGGACVASGQLFGAGSLSYDEDLGLKNFGFDVERAKSLITEAGAENAKFEIVTFAGVQFIEQATAILQEQLKKIGLDPTVKALDPLQLVTRFAIEKSAAMAWGATGNAFDPSVWLDRNVMPGGIYNPGSFEIPAAIELAEQALVETDQDKRNEIYRELSGAIDSTSFIVPVASPATTFVLAKHVQGWQAPWGESFASFRGVSG